MNNHNNIFVVRRNADIREAVNAWCSNKASAEAQYGHISQWDTSEVTNMRELFNRKKDFNDDISGWNVSNVTTMEWMFNGATRMEERNKCANKGW